MKFVLFNFEPESYLELFKATHVPAPPAWIEPGKLQVKPRLEPTNEKDKNAIAIDINHGSGFFHCGYIASELTQYLHPLIDTDKIVDVSLEHIQFRVSFSRMGYYPKVLITTKGAWEKFVIYRCCSTI